MEIHFDVPVAANETRIDKRLRRESGEPAKSVKLSSAQRRATDHLVHVAGKDVYQ